MLVFARQESSFDPASAPVVGFERLEHCAALLEQSRAGDKLLIVGAVDEETRPHERGLLLGLAEFGRTAIRTEDVIKGQQRYLLPLTRAWRFTTKLKLLDTLQDRFVVESDRCAELSAADGALVLALPCCEVVVASAWPPLEDATTGPVPTDWSGTIARQAGVDTWTYVLRFGTRDIWKVGQTQDLHARLEQVNQHVPHEELGEVWQIVLSRRWPDAQKAYEMEQGLLHALGRYRTAGERVRCAAEQINQVWSALSL